MSTPPNRSHSPQASEDIVEDDESLQKKIDELEDEVNRLRTENADLEYEHAEFENTIREQKDMIRAIETPEQSDFINALLGTQEIHTSEISRLEEQVRVQLETITEHEATIHWYQDIVQSSTGTEKKEYDEEKEDPDLMNEDTHPTKDANDCSVQEHKYIIRFLEGRIKELEARLYECIRRAEASSRKRHDPDQPVPAQIAALEEEKRGLKKQLDSLKWRFDKSEAKVQHCGEHRQELETKCRHQKEHIEWLQQRLSNAEKEGEEKGTCEGKCRVLKRKLIEMAEGVNRCGESFGEMVEETLKGVDFSDIEYEDGDDDDDNTGGDADKGKQGW
ncbi:Nn.00g014020.m01.CDS01 [Neocucurbitaria sp. VM-36]